jgi:hypothetical protein
LSTFLKLILIILSLLLSIDVLAQIPEGILSAPKQFAEQDTTTQKVERIEPWKKGIDHGHQIVTNDSLLRWEIWPNWGDYLSYRKDVIGFRQGTTGRIDAFEIEGYSPLEQKVYLNGIALNDPITGYVNYNHIPANRVGSMSEFKGVGYDSNIQLKDYYLLEPLSYLNFDEASNNFRNLEFMVAQNFSERTNAEISFWDRRDGGNYLDNDIQGSQIILKGYHYLKQNLQLRALVLRNQFERGEPFGYNYDNQQTFTFSKYTTSPNIQNKTSDNLRRDISIGLYSRKDSLSIETWGIEIQHNKDEFKLPFTTDTLNWDVRRHVLKGFMNHTLANFDIHGTFSINRYNAKKHKNFTISNWNTIEIDGDAELRAGKELNIYVKNHLIYRDDSNIGYHTNIGMQKFGDLRFNINIGLFSRIPSIQQKYWSSSIFSGVENLQNTHGVSLSSKIEINKGDFFDFGISGRMQFIDKDIFKGTDSSFVNSDVYSVLSGSIFATFQNHRYTIESSATIHAATATEPRSVLDANNKPDQKLWVRNNAYIQGYVFKRAAYIKLGILTTFSPLTYRSRLYNTELQFWENAAFDEFEIPAFFRMDAELSARLRSMMILIRWENALDGFGQLGYFEAATLPMPGRRLIIGVRAQFRN